MDFPDFVRDLLNGIFDATVEAVLKQMGNCRDPLREAAASVATLVRAVSARYKEITSLDH